MNWLGENKFNSFTANLGSNSNSVLPTQYEILSKPNGSENSQLLSLLHLS